MRGACCVLTSGTHGAEGFCGSGCQVGFLHDDAFVASASAAPVSRRVRCTRSIRTASRTCAAPTRTTSTSTATSATSRRRRRRTAPMPTCTASWCRRRGRRPPTTRRGSRAYVQAHGERALQQAVSSGQCEYPDGLFYGGVRPAWSNGVLRAVLREHARAAATLGWIDFHTGLGPRGHGEKILAARADPADVARAKAWWGADVTSFHDGSSTSAPLTGVNYNAAYDECPQAAYAGIALEYGTQSFAEVLGALRADQWLDNHPDAPATQRAAIKRAMRDAFYHGRRRLEGAPSTRRRSRPPAPRSPAWRATRAHERAAVEANRMRSTSSAEPAATARRAVAADAHRRGLGQRRRLELPPFAGRDRVARGVRRLRARRAVRAVDRAAQSVRPARRSTCRTRACRRRGSRAGGRSSCWGPTTRAATCCPRSCTARGSRCWSAWRRWRSRWSWASRSAWSRATSAARSTRSSCASPTSSCRSRPS